MKTYVSETIHRIARAERVQEADAAVAKLVDGHLRILDRDWPRVRPDRDERACPYCHTREADPHDDRCPIRISCEAMGFPLPDAWEVARKHESAREWGRIIDETLAEDRKREAAE